jgi:Flp pilus assembly protein TadB
MPKNSKAQSNQPTNNKKKKRQQQRQQQAAQAQQQLQTQSTSTKEKAKVITVTTTTTAKPSGATTRPASANAVPRSLLLHTLLGVALCALVLLVWVQVRFLHLVLMHFHLFQSLFWSII